MHMPSEKILHLHVVIPAEDALKIFTLDLGMNWGVSNNFKNLYFLLKCLLP